MMASRFDVIAGFDRVRSDPHSLKSGAAGGFESPHLRLTLRVFDFQINPGMGHDQVDLFDDTFDVHKGIFIITVRMVRPGGRSESDCTNHSDTYSEFQM